MPVTRSATRGAIVAVNSTNASEETTVAATESTVKRKRTTASKAPVKRARATKSTSGTGTTPTEAVPAVAPSRPVHTADGESEELVPAVLTFSFEEAKQHLISVDPRFEDVFRRVKCKPYEHLERVDPFRWVVFPKVSQDLKLSAIGRTLAHSIL